MSGKEKLKKVIFTLNTIKGSYKQFKCRACPTKTSG